MFRGANAINLDAKGRMALPSKYRELLQERSEGKMVLTIDTEDPCLLLYPLEDWAVIEQKVNQLPSFNKAARRIQRLLVGHATEVELDAQGRIVVPPVLRDYAKLEKKSMLIGQGNKFELWSEDIWSQSREDWLETSKEDDLPDDVQQLVL